MTTSIIAIVASLLIFLFVFDLLRRGVLKEKYAVLWLFVSGIGIIFAVIPGLLDWIGTSLGIGAPVNLLFFIMGVVLLLVSVQMSYELSRHEARIRRLAEEVALLREHIDMRHREERRGDE